MSWLGQSSIRNAQRRADALEARFQAALRSYSQSDDASAASAASVHSSKASLTRSVPRRPPPAVPPRATEPPPSSSSSSSSSLAGSTATGGLPSVSGVEQASSSASALGMSGDGEEASLATQSLEEQSSGAIVGDAKTSSANSRSSRGSGRRSSYRPDAREARLTRQVRDMESRIGELTSRSLRSEQERVALLKQLESERAERAQRERDWQNSSTVAAEELRNEYEARAREQERAATAQAMAQLEEVQAQSLRDREALQRELDELRQNLEEERGVLRTHQHQAQTEVSSLKNALAELGSAHLSSRSQTQALVAISSEIRECQSTEQLVSYCQQRLSPMLQCSTAALFVYQQQRRGHTPDWGRAAATSSSAAASASSPTRHRHKASTATSLWTVRYSDTVELDCTREVVGSLVDVARRGVVCSARLPHQELGAVEAAIAAHRPVWLRDERYRSSVSAQNRLMEDVEDPDDQLFDLDDDREAVPGARSNERGDDAAAWQHSPPSSTLYQHRGSTSVTSASPSSGRRTSDPVQWLRAVALLVWIHGSPPASARGPSTVAPHIEVAEPSQEFVHQHHLRSREEEEEDKEQRAAIGRGGAGAMGHTAVGDDDVRSAFGGDAAIRDRWSILAVPVLDREDVVVGVLALTRDPNNPKGAFSQEEQALVESLARQIALVLTHCQHIAALGAVHDNLGHMQEALQRADSLLRGLETVRLSACLHSLVGAGADVSEEIVASSDLRQPPVPKFGSPQSHRAHAAGATPRTGCVAAFVLAPPFAQQSGQDDAVSSRSVEFWIAQREPDDGVTNASTLPRRRGRFLNTRTMVDYRHILVRALHHHSATGSAEDGARTGVSTLSGGGGSRAAGADASSIDGALHCVTMPDEDDDLLSGQRLRAETDSLGAAPTSATQTSAWNTRALSSLGDLLFGVPLWQAVLCPAVDLEDVRWGVLVVAETVEQHQRWAQRQRSQIQSPTATAAAQPTTVQDHPLARSKEALVYLAAQLGSSAHRLATELQARRAAQLSSGFSRCCSAVIRETAHLTRLANTTSVTAEHGLGPLMLQQRPSPSAQHDASAMDTSGVATAPASDAAAAVGGLPSETSTELEARVLRPQRQAILDQLRALARRVTAALALTTTPPEGVEEDAHAFQSAPRNLLAPVIDCTFCAMLVAEDAVSGAGAGIATRDVFCLAHRDTGAIAVGGIGQGPETSRAGWTLHTHTGTECRLTVPDVCASLSRNEVVRLRASPDAEEPLRAVLSELAPVMALGSAAVAEQQQQHLLRTHAAAGGVDSLCLAPVLSSDGGRLLALLVLAGKRHRVFERGDRWIPLEPLPIPSMARTRLGGLEWLSGFTDADASHLRSTQVAGHLTAWLEHVQWLVSAFSDRYVSTLQTQALRHAHWRQVMQARACASVLSVVQWRQEQPPRLRLAWARWKGATVSRARAVASEEQLFELEEQLSTTRTQLRNTTDEYEQDARMWKERHESSEALHEQELQTVRAAFASDLKREQERHADEVQHMQTEHATQINALERDHVQALQRLQSSHYQDMQQQTEQHEAALQAMRATQQELESRLSKMEEDHAVTLAQMRAAHTEEKTEALENMTTQWEKVVGGVRAELEAARQANAHALSAHNHAVESQQDAMEEQRNDFETKLKDTEAAARRQIVWNDQQHQAQRKVWRARWKWFHRALAVLHKHCNNPLRPPRPVRPPQQQYPLRRGQTIVPLSSSSSSASGSVQCIRQLASALSALRSTVVGVRGSAMRVHILPQNPVWVRDAQSPPRKQSVRAGQGSSSTSTGAEQSARNEQEEARNAALSVALAELQGVCRLTFHGDDVVDDSNAMLASESDDAATVPQRSRNPGWGAEMDDRTNDHDQDSEDERLRSGEILDESEAADGKEDWEEDEERPLPQHWHQLGEQHQGPNLLGSHRRSDRAASARMRQWSNFSEAESLHRLSAMSQGCGVLGRAVVVGQPISVKDTSSCPFFDPAVDTPARCSIGDPGATSGAVPPAAMVGAHCVCAVPLTITLPPLRALALPDDDNTNGTGDEDSFSAAERVSLGALEFLHPDVGGFSPEDRQMITCLCESIVLCLSNAVHVLILRSLQEKHGVHPLPLKRILSAHEEFLARLCGTLVQTHGTLRACTEEITQIPTQSVTDGWYRHGSHGSASSQAWSEDRATSAAVSATASGFPIPDSTREKITGVCDAFVDTVMQATGAVHVHMSTTSAFGEVHRSRSASSDSQHHASFTGGGVAVAAAGGGNGGSGGGAPGSRMHRLQLAVPSTGCNAAQDVAVATTPLCNPGSSPSTTGVFDVGSMDVVLGEHALDNAPTLALCQALAQSAASCIVSLAAQAALEHGALDSCGAYRTAVEELRKEKALNLGQAVEVQDLQSQQASLQSAVHASQTVLAMGDSAVSDILLHTQITAVLLQAAQQRPCQMLVPTEGGKRAAGTVAQPVSHQGAALRDLVRSLTFRCLPPQSVSYHYQRAGEAVLAATTGSVVQEWQTVTGTQLDSVSLVLYGSDGAKRQELELALPEHACAVVLFDGAPTAASSVAAPAPQVGGSFTVEAILVFSAAIPAPSTSSSVSMPVTSAAAVDPTSMPAQAQPEDRHAQKCTQLCCFLLDSVQQTLRRHRLRSLLRDANDVLGSVHELRQAYDDKSAQALALEQELSSTRTRLEATVDSLSAAERTAAAELADARAEHASALEASNARCAARVQEVENQLAAAEQEQHNTETRVAEIQRQAFVDMAGRRAYQMLSTVCEQTLLFERVRNLGHSLFGATDTHLCFFPPRGARPRWAAGAAAAATAELEGMAESMERNMILQSPAMNQGWRRLWLAEAVTDAMQSGAPFKVCSATGREGVTVTALCAVLFESRAEMGLNDNDHDIVAALLPERLTRRLGDCSADVVQVRRQQQQQEETQHPSDGGEANASLEQEPFAEEDGHARHLVPVGCLVFELGTAATAAAAVGGRVTSSPVRPPRQREGTPASPPATATTAQTPDSINARVPDEVYGHREHTASQGTGLWNVASPADAQAVAAFWHDTAKQLAAGKLCPAVVLACWRCVSSAIYDRLAVSATVGRQLQECVHHGASLWQHCESALRNGESGFVYLSHLARRFEAGTKALLTECRRTEYDAPPGPARAFHAQLFIPQDEFDESRHISIGVVDGAEAGVKATMGDTGVTGLRVVCAASGESTIWTANDDAWHAVKKAVPILRANRLIVPVLRPSTSNVAGNMQQRSRLVAVCTLAGDMMQAFANEDDGDSGVSADAPSNTLPVVPPAATPFSAAEQAVFQAWSTCVIPPLDAWKRAMQAANEADRAAHVVAKLQRKVANSAHLLAADVTALERMHSALQVFHAFSKQGTQHTSCLRQLLRSPAEPEHEIHSAGVGMVRLPAVPRVPLQEVMDLAFAQQASHSRSSSGGQFADVDVDGGEAGMRIITLLQALTVNVERAVLNVSALAVEAVALFFFATGSSASSPSHRGRANHNHDEQDGQEPFLWTYWCGSRLFADMTERELVRVPLATATLEFQALADGTALLASSRPGDTTTSVSSGVGTAPATAPSSYSTSSSWLWRESRRLVSVGTAHAPSDILVVPLHATGSGGTTAEHADGTAALGVLSVVISRNATSTHMDSTAASVRLQRPVEQSVQQTRVGDADQHHRDAFVPHSPLVREVVERPQPSPGTTSPRALQDNSRNSGGITTGDVLFMSVLAQEAATVLLGHVFAVSAWKVHQNFRRCARDVELLRERDGFLHTVSQTGGMQSLVSRQALQELLQTRIPSLLLAAQQGEETEDISFSTPPQASGGVATSPLSHAMRDTDSNGRDGTESSDGAVAEMQVQSSPEAELARSMPVCPEWCVVSASVDVRQRESSLPAALIAVKQGECTASMLRYDLMVPGEGMASAIPLPQAFRPSSSDATAATTTATATAEFNGNSPASEPLWWARGAVVVQHVGQHVTSEDEERDEDGHAADVSGRECRSGVYLVGATVEVVLPAQWAGASMAQHPVVQALCGQHLSIALLPVAADLSSHNSVFLADIGRLATHSSSRPWCLGTNPDSAYTRASVAEIVSTLTDCARARIVSQVTSQAATYFVESARAAQRQLRTQYDQQLAVEAEAHHDQLVRTQAEHQEQVSRLVAGHEAWKATAEAEREAQLGELERAHTLQREHASREQAERIAQMEEAQVQQERTHRKMEEMHRTELETLRNEHESTLHELQSEHERVQSALTRKMEQDAQASEKSLQCRVKELLEEHAAAILVLKEKHATELQSVVSQGESREATLNQDMERQRQQLQQLLDTERSLRETDEARWRERLDNELRAAESKVAEARATQLRGFESEMRAALAQKDSEAEKELNAVEERRREEVGALQDHLHAQDTQHKETLSQMESRLSEYESLAQHLEQELDMSKSAVVALDKHYSDEIAHQTASQANESRKQLLLFARQCELRVRQLQAQLADSRHATAALSELVRALPDACSRAAGSDWIAALKSLSSNACQSVVQLPCAWRWLGSTAIVAALQAAIQTALDAGQTSVSLASDIAWRERVRWPQVEALDMSARSTSREDRPGTDETVAVAASAAAASTELPGSEAEQQAQQHAVDDVNEHTVDGYRYLTTTALFVTESSEDGENRTTRGGVPHSLHKSIKLWRLVHPSVPGSTAMPASMSSLPDTEPSGAHWTSLASVGGDTTATVEPAVVACALRGQSVVAAHPRSMWQRVIGGTPGIGRNTDSVAEGGDCANEDLHGDDQSLGDDALAAHDGAASSARFAGSQLPRSLLTRTRTHLRAHLHSMSTPPRSTRQQVPHNFSMRDSTAVVASPYVSRQLDFDRLHSMASSHLALDTAHIAVPVQWAFSFEAMLGRPEVGSTAPMRSTTAMPVAVLRVSVVALREQEHPQRRAPASPTRQERQQSPQEHSAETAGDVVTRALRLATDAVEVCKAVLHAQFARHVRTMAAHAQGVDKLVRTMHISRSRKALHHWHRVCVHGRRTQLSRQVAQMEQMHRQLRERAEQIERAIVCGSRLALVSRRLSAPATFRLLGTSMAQLGQWASGYTAVSFLVPFRPNASAAAVVADMDVDDSLFGLVQFPGASFDSGRAAGAAGDVDDDDTDENEGELQHTPHPLHPAPGLSVLALPPSSTQAKVALSILRARQRTLDTAMATEGGAHSHTSSPPAPISVCSHLETPLVGGVVVVPRSALDAGVEKTSIVLDQAALPHPDVEEGARGEKEEDEQQQQQQVAMHDRTSSPHSRFDIFVPIWCQEDSAPTTATAAATATGVNAPQSRTQLQCIVVLHCARRAPVTAVTATTARIGADSDDLVLRNDATAWVALCNTASPVLARLVDVAREQAHLRSSTRVLERQRERAVQAALMDRDRSRANERDASTQRLRFSRALRFAATASDVLLAEVLREGTDAASAAAVGEIVEAGLNRALAQHWNGVTCRLQVVATEEYYGGGDGNGAGRGSGASSQGGVVTPPHLPAGSATANAEDARAHVPVMLTDTETFAVLEMYVRHPDPAPVPGASDDGFVISAAPSARMPFSSPSATPATDGDLAVVVEMCLAVIRPCLRCWLSALAAQQRSTRSEFVLRQMEAQHEQLRAALATQQADLFDASHSHHLNTSLQAVFGALLRACPDTDAVLQAAVVRLTAIAQAVTSEAATRGRRETSEIAPSATATIIAAVPVRVLGVAPTADMLEAAGYDVGNITEAMWESLIRTCMAGVVSLPAASASFSSSSSTTASATASTTAARADRRLHISPHVVAPCVHAALHAVRTRTTCSTQILLGGGPTLDADVDQSSMAIATQVALVLAVPVLDRAREGSVMAVLFVFESQGALYIREQQPQQQRRRQEEEPHMSGRQLPPQQQNLQGYPFSSFVVHGSLEEQFSALRDALSTCLHVHRSGHREKCFVEQANRLRRWCAEVPRLISSVSPRLAGLFNAVAEFAPLCLQDGLLELPTVAASTTNTTSTGSTTATAATNLYAGRQQCVARLFMRCSDESVVTLGDSGVLRRVPGAPPQQCVAASVGVDGALWRHPLDNLQRYDPKVDAAPNDFRVDRREWLMTVIAVPLAAPVRWCAEDSATSQAAAPMDTGVSHQEAGTSVAGRNPDVAVAIVLEVLHRRRPERQRGPPVSSDAGSRNGVDTNGSGARREGVLNQGTPTAAVSELCKLTARTVAQCMYSCLREWAIHAGQEQAQEQVARQAGDVRAMQSVLVAEQRATERAQEELRVAQRLLSACRTQSEARTVQFTETISSLWTACLGGPPLSGSTPRVPATAFASAVAVATTRPHNSNTGGTSDRVENAPLPNVQADCWRRVLHMMRAVRIGMSRWAPPSGAAAAANLTVDTALARQATASELHGKDNEADDKEEEEEEETKKQRKKSATDKDSEPQSARSLARWLNTPVSSPDGLAASTVEIELHGRNGGEEDVARVSTDATSQVGGATDSVQSELFLLSTLPSARRPLGEADEFAATRCFVEDLAQASGAQAVIDIHARERGGEPDNPHLWTSGASTVQPAGIGEGSRSSIRWVPVRSQPEPSGRAHGSMALCARSAVPQVESVLTEFEDNVASPLASHTRLLCLPIVLHVSPSDWKQWLRDVHAMLVGSAPAPQMAAANGFVVGVLRVVLPEKDAAERVTLHRADEATLVAVFAMHQLVCAGLQQVMLQWLCVHQDVRLEQVASAGRQLRALAGPDDTEAKTAAAAAADSVAVAATTPATTAAATESSGARALSKLRLSAKSKIKAKGKATQSRSPARTHAESLTEDATRVGVLREVHRIVQAVCRRMEHACIQGMRSQLTAGQQSLAPQTVDWRVGQAVMEMLQATCRLLRADGAALIHFPPTATGVDTLCPDAGSPIVARCDTVGAELHRGGDSLTVTIPPLPDSQGLVGGLLRRLVRRVRKADTGNSPAVRTPEMLRASLQQLQEARASPAESRSAESHHSMRSVSLPNANTDPAYNAAVDGTCSDGTAMLLIPVPCVPAVLGSGREPELFLQGGVLQVARRLNGATFAGEDVLAAELCASMTMLLVSGQNTGAVALRGMLHELNELRAVAAEPEPSSPGAAPASATEPGPDVLSAGLRGFLARSRQELDQMRQVPLARNDSAP